MATCKADIRRWGSDELLSYFNARVTEWIESGRFQSNDQVVAKCNEELAVYDAEGAWSAGCVCGWKGNNPYPSKESAVSSLEAHYEGVRNG